MPTVVFEIHGREFPLPPSAYTNQVCTSRDALGPSSIPSPGTLVKTNGVDQTKNTSPLE